MIDAERREAARQFVNKWNQKGNEEQDSQLFWIDFLTDVVGMENVTNRVNFEKKVVVDGHSKKIDVYIPETHTLIEQKSIGKSLDKKITNSGDIELTPYEQAKRYNDNLPYDEKARWIVTSNFAEIWIYDMNMVVPEPVKIKLFELQNKFPLFDFMTNKEQKKISQEMEISIKAGDFVGLIYDALHKQYKNPDNKESLKSLNILCVRLVFCLYAEDAHIFGTSGHMFHDYLEHFETKDMRKALIELFKTLDTPEDKRDPYENSNLTDFPYVNGGLFAQEDVEIPNFTDEIRDILLVKASEGFDWSKISPTIFGAVFESTLNPETRRNGGMHYTSIEKIHKVIDPLFLNALKAELAEIKAVPVIKNRKSMLKEFQDKLSKLTWLDPACGSGNFLTETYISIRRLENDVINELSGGQIAFLTKDTNPIRVNINQFYGIEINDFAVTVAKTALWIAESQMMKETESILRMQLDFLPLKTNANIIENNALRIDWNDVISSSKLSYIMGNPPFVGARLMSSEQKEDLKIVFGNKISIGNLDYVSGWYIKAADYINGTIKVALVSTNSITQGEQVSILWSQLLKRGISINFAYRTFRWDSEAKIKAHVHCVIIGFSQEKSTNCFLYISNICKQVNHINAYLVDGPDILIDSRKKPICDISSVVFGSMPNDGGFLSDFSDGMKEEIVSKYPLAEKMFRPFLGATEFLHGKKRWCLWLKDVSPADIKKVSPVMEAVTSVKKMREKSNRAETKKLAEFPYLFGEIRQPTSEYIIIPRHSSENRRYIPMGFVSSNVICGDSNLLLPNANLFQFGILMSNVHNAWIRTVCGRIKSDYRYSVNIVYNNFPWPTVTEDIKGLVEKTAQGILDARKLYPNSSLADLYDPLIMPIELQKAHTANNAAVMKAYGFSTKDIDEEKCVVALMELYKNILEK